MRSKVGQIFAGLLIAAFSVTPTAAQTQSQIEKRYTRDYNQCMDAAEGVTVDMMDCIGAEIDRQDARLNQAYVMVMRPLSRAKKDQLRGLQRSWIRQRDARCSRASNDAGGGSLSGVVYASCILDETIKRTVFLENYKG
ncbi:MULTISPECIES: lysozyme inhibitor LprI family protein [unclassified Novosphingobium]|uniref:lysozyme inhibitor LprI family protein n=1 Tax=unclassified Novosphingobium TaxID=2644732 RepID=UPI0025FC0065|nr:MULTISPECIES: lysozyme inhibitor LprI family protein [unclassified Novosphingobium]HQV04355.1 lysozyme inhibitor LprI family protein [Novosphingobium sp.]